MKTRVLLLAAIFVFPALLPAQTNIELQQVLDRLNRLEQENRQLKQEVQSLRQALEDAEIVPVVQPKEVVADPPVVPLDERLAVQESRVNELARTSVQASQRLPVSLSGMVLFNTYINRGASGGSQFAPVAALDGPRNGAGASPRQSIVGLEYQGPTILKGGQVNGSVSLDLWGGSSNSLDHYIRLRTSGIYIDWENQSLFVGQDKPLISPREPTSLAQVWVSPLAGAGNLWSWQPQARFEQRIGFSDSAGLRAQAAVFQFADPGDDRPGDYYGATRSARPAFQTRMEFWRDFSNSRRIAIAPGFHVSESQRGPFSMPSRIYSVDWLLKPNSALEFTGTFFRGQNAAGLGGLRQGYTRFPSGEYVSVHATGGWAQLSWFATNRLTFSLYGGQESNRGADLLTGQVSRNLSYTGNLSYQLGPNLLFGLEASQVRTTYTPGELRLLNHYDLALAYLF